MFGKFIILGAIQAGELLADKYAERKVVSSWDGDSLAELLDEIDKLPDQNVLNLTKHHNEEIRDVAKEIARYRELI